MYKITIEAEGKATEYFFDNVQIHQERGIDRKYDQDGELISIDANGKERLLIKAWSGCDELEQIV
jgi:hypothetical protein